MPTGFGALAGNIAGLSGRLRGNLQGIQRRDAQGQQNFANSLRLANDQQDQANFVANQNQQNYWRGQQMSQQDRQFNANMSLRQQQFARQGDFRQQDLAQRDRLFARQGDYRQQDIVQRSLQNNLSRDRLGLSERQFEAGLPQNRLAATQGFLSENFNLSDPGIGRDPAFNAMFPQAARNLAPRQVKATSLADRIKLADLQQNTQQDITSALAAGGTQSSQVVRDAARRLESISGVQGSGAQAVRTAIGRQPTVNPSLLGTAGRFLTSPSTVASEYRFDRQFGDEISKIERKIQEGVATQDEIQRLRSLAFKRKSIQGELYSDLRSAPGIGGLF